MDFFLHQMEVAVVGRGWRRVRCNDRLRELLMTQWCLYERGDAPPLRMKHSIHSRLTERQTGSSFTAEMFIIINTGLNLADCTHSLAGINIAEHARSFLLYVLAVVEDDGAVGPAVMIHQTQIREKSDPNRLKAPLVTHSEAVAVNLENHRLNFILAVGAFRAQCEIKAAEEESQDSSAGSPDDKAHC